MSWKTVKLGTIISQRKEWITIDDSVQYKRCRVQVNRKGIVLRDIIKGIFINTKKQQVCRNGDFLVAEIDAKVGGYGFVGEDLDGAIVSSHYFLFEVDETKMLKAYLAWLIKTEIIQEQINSKGSTNYAAIRPGNVLNFEIPLPSIKEQKLLIERLNEVDKNYSAVQNELALQQSYLTQLGQSILQEAVQGKLTQQNPADEPATKLLERIKAEKQKLIAAGKLKKEKPLPPITANEIPFELPEGWVWCRLGEVVKINGGKRLPNGHQLVKENTGRIYIRVTDMKNGSIDDSDLHYINENSYSQIKNYFIEKDDVYLVIVGSTIGKSGIVPEKFHMMNLTENAVKLKPILFERLYLDYALKSSFMLEQFSNRTNQLGQPKLAIIRIQNSLFPLPPLSEQHRIVVKVQQLLQQVSTIEQQVQQSQIQAQQLLQAVLKEAFQVSGTSKVSDTYTENDLITMAAEE